MERVFIKSGGRMYRIPKAGPFEPIAQVCERGAYIIHQTQGCDDETNKKEWIEASFLTVYERQGLGFAKAV
jgi:hypothetical protein